VRLLATITGFAAVLTAVALASITPSFAAGGTVCTWEGTAYCATLNVNPQGNSCLETVCRGGAPAAAGTTFTCVQVTPTDRYGNITNNNAFCTNNSAAIALGICCQGQCLARVKWMCPQVPGVNCQYVGGMCQAPGTSTVCPSAVMMDLPSPVAVCYVDQMRRIRKGRAAR